VTRALRDQHHVVAFAVDVRPGDHTLTATSDSGTEHTVELTTPVVTQSCRPATRQRRVRQRWDPLAG
jgi:hypothetical protein